jgi:antitoxin YefM
MCMKMRTMNYSELRAGLKKSLDVVSDDGELLIVHRPKGRSLVVMSMKNYNSFVETQYLLQNKNNRDRLEQAVNNINAKNDLIKNPLMEY